MALTSMTRSHSSAPSSATGAIEKVLVSEGRLQVNIIGDGAAAGLCGTALIDAAAEMLRHELMETTGRIRSQAEVAENTPADLRRRVAGEAVRRADGDVRDGLARNDYKDPGPYAHPKGTVASEYKGTDQVPEIKMPPGCASACRRAAMFTPSPKMS